MRSSGGGVGHECDLFFGFAARDRTLRQGIGGAADPSAGGTDVGSGFVQMAAEAAGLDLELPAQPSGGTNGAQR